MSTHIWLLERDDVSITESRLAGVPHYNGFVVQAASEKEARALAQKFAFEKAGHETRSAEWGGMQVSEWIHSARCELIGIATRASEPSQVILYDYTPVSSRASET